MAAPRCKCPGKDRNEHELPDGGRAAIGYDWLMEHTEVVTWMPTRRLDAVSWNGIVLPVPVQVGVTITTPAVFRDLAERPQV